MICVLNFILCCVKYKMIPLRSSYYVYLIPYTWCYTIPWIIFFNLSLPCLSYLYLVPCTIKNDELKLVFYDMTYTTLHVRIITLESRQRKHVGIYFYLFFIPTFSLCFFFLFVQCTYLILDLLLLTFQFYLVPIPNFAVFPKSYFYFYLGIPCIFYLVYLNDVW